MVELQLLFEEQAKRVVECSVRRCVQAGTVGAIHNTAVNSKVESSRSGREDLLLFRGQRPKEVFVRGSQVRRRHGAFSYYVIKVWRVES